MDSNQYFSFPVSLKNIKFTNGVYTHIQDLLPEVPFNEILAVGNHSCKGYVEVKTNQSEECVGNSDQ